MENTHPASKVDNTGKNQGDDDGKNNGNGNDDNTSNSNANTKKRKAHDAAVLISPKEAKLQQERSCPQRKVTSFVPEYSFPRHIDVTFAEWMKAGKTFDNIKKHVILQEAGTYDIIFIYISGRLLSDKYNLHRTSSGTLEMLNNGNEGILSFDKSVKDGLPEMHQSNIHFKRDDHCSFSISNYDELVGHEKWEYEHQPIPVVASQVGEKCALRWELDGMSCFNPVDKDSIQEKYTESLKLDKDNSYAQNAAVASKKLEEHHAGKPILWLSHHKGISENASTLIQQYMTSIPPPYFFYQAGDIVLEFCWDQRYIEEFSTHVVVRCRG